MAIHIRIHNRAKWKALITDNGDVDLMLVDDDEAQLPLPVDLPPALAANPATDICIDVNGNKVWPPTGIETK